MSHCKHINLMGTSDIDIQGTGQLEISTINTCAGVATNSSSGCSIGSWSSFSYTLGAPDISAGCGTSIVGITYPVGSPCSPIGSQNYILTPGPSCGDCFAPLSCMYDRVQTCQ